MFVNIFIMEIKCAFLLLLLLLLFTFFLLPVLNNCSNHFYLITF